MVNLTNASGSIIFWIGDAKIARHEINVLSLRNLLEVISSITETPKFYTRVTVEIAGLVKEIYSR